MAIAKTTKIGEILDADTGVDTVFLNMGMHCIGRPASRNETLEQACLAHGLDSDELVKRLNDCSLSK